MPYRIICTRQLPVSNPTSHAHITHVGTGATTANYELLWTVQQVFDAMARGEKFYTVSPSTGKIASVTRVKCPRCTHDVLRSAADAVTDNNLDSLPKCQ